MTKARIRIIGPSGSGKSTLAKALSKKLKIKCYALDNICFEHLPNKKRRVLEKDEYINKLLNIIKKDSWIIEGLQPVEEVFESSDVIIWLKPAVFVSLYRQWKRFLQDSQQRNQYGFTNNVKLSMYILRQYYGKPTDESDPKKTWIKSVNKILERYKNKLV